MARPTESGVKRPRISIDVHPQIRCRLRLAPAKRNLTIRRYMLAAIEERLREDLRDDVEGIGGLIASAQVLAGLWDNRKDAEYDRLYNGERKEVVVAAITSNVRRHPFGDSLLVDWKDAGLLFPSVATGILRTGTRGMVDRKLGTMAKGDLDAVDNGLRPSLAL
jgi:hypothetical protein